VTAVALHDFAGEGKHELDFKEGDEILNIQKEEGGWWHGDYTRIPPAVCESLK